MWTTTQITLGLLSLVLVFIGNKLTIPFFTDLGIVCLGLTSSIIGWEAIFTQHIVIGRRRHGSRQTYTGLAAILQGIEFNLIGLFLVAIAFMLYQNISPRDLGLQIARHPGWPLILFGVLCMIQSGITLIGPLDSQDHSRWIEITSLLVARLLPGTILVVIGLGMTGLGVFEILAPKAFDQMGGRLLETLHGIK